MLFLLLAAFDEAGPTCNIAQSNASVEIHSLPECELEVSK